MEYLRDENQSREYTEVLTKPNQDYSKIKYLYSEIYSESQVQHTRKHHSRFLPSNHSRLSRRVSANEWLAIAYSNYLFCLENNQTSDSCENLCVQLRRFDGRYRVKLSWKPGLREALKNNKTVTRKSFEGLVCRLKCDPELFYEYKDVIDDYFENDENDDDVKDPSFAPQDLQYDSSSEEETNEEVSVVPEISTVSSV
ncbi:hypothetical protein NPIL_167921 [Nephila pilipes]|uniref:Uncharacterized protein n=1 Tax=Nephila pilipes TaxID=299642 RepID=A0A8X6PPA4_NEPPI|nr:hypothetical protein NPIL_167921 [Nephila pilipes]